MNKTNKIVGCSFDGLKDRLFVHGNNSPHYTDFYMADVVLPKHFGGHLLTGEIAECDRSSSGYHWPPEAQINDGSNLRRIPVSWAWRLFIDAEEKYGSGYTRWSIGGGISFSISKVLTAHIVDKLGSEKDNADKIVIAIPNDLNEFRQQELINELVLQGIGSRREKPLLLWRPIAAAIAWLDKVHIPENISKEDFILVIHIGPDCIEFVTLRLREIMHKDKRYIVPVRETQYNKYSLCGCDWAAEFIDQVFDAKELDEMWQCFTNFPETWKTLAQQPWDFDELPRVLSCGESWELWEPEESCKERIWQLETKNSSCLDILTSKNYKHKRADSTFESWEEFFQHGIVETLDNCEMGDLRGMILSGPLASTFPSHWLKEAAPLLKERGLNIEVRREASYDSIWAPELSQDIVSEGSSIYGARLISGEPTYLDTIPQLYTFVEKSGMAEWEPLLKSSDRSMENEIEIAGSVPLEIEHKRRFSLKSDRKRLDVFLRKGSSEIFKKTTFFFPYAPKEDMLLNIKICAASANGLARVELIPEKQEFLGGQQVLMDYSRMEEANDLPKIKLGFPPISDFEIDTKDYRMFHVHSFRQTIDDFRNSRITDQDYDMHVSKLRSQIQRLSLWNINLFRIVNKDGKAGTDEGQIIIDAISKKLGSDFSRLLVNENGNTAIIRKVLGASTWLFGAAPPEVVSYLRRRLEDENATKGIGTVVEGAGRCFTEKDDIALLFKASISRLHRGFKLYWIKAIWYVFFLRDSAPDAMEKSYADIFVKQVLARMCECADSKNFTMTFMQSVRMFLYLLRFRQNEREFLAYELQSYRECFNEIISCLESAKLYFEEQSRISYRRALFTRKNRITAEYLQEVEKYMRYEGGDIIRLEQELFSDDENG